MEVENKPLRIVFMIHRNKTIDIHEATTDEDARILFAAMLKFKLISSILEESYTTREFIMQLEYDGN